MNQKFLKRIVAHYVRDGEIPYASIIRDAKGAFEIFKEYLPVRDREEFISIHLDRGNRPVCWDRVSVGTLTETIVSPKEVFKTALLSNASSVIFLHNHPSGRPEPSREDMTLTKKLKEVGELLDIRVLDHLIVFSEDGFYSFQEHGLL